MANLDFIDQIGQIAVKAYKELGKVKPSICIAMAITESSWGTAGSVKYHSYLGQKRGTGKTATKYWSGQSFSARTQECYNQASGQLTTICDSFRCYDSMEQCVFNYYELLNTKLYKGVVDCEPYEQIQQIKNCGYFTSTTEVNTVRKLIEQYDLERYDGLDYNADIDKVIPGENSHGNIAGVVDLCRYIGIDESFENRKYMAERMGIEEYKGTSEQNMELMHKIAVICLNAACEVLGR